MADHFNAEVVAGTIASKQDAIDYLTWTFFYRRLLQNPSYYNLESTEMADVSEFLSDMVETTMATLQVVIQLGCSLSLQQYMHCHCQRIRSRAADERPCSWYSNVALGV